MFVSLYNGLSEERGVINRLQCAHLLLPDIRKDDRDGTRVLQEKARGKNTPPLAASI